MGSPTIDQIILIKTSTEKNALETTKSETIATDMKNPPLNQSISNIFSNQQPEHQGKQTANGKNSSDIFNLKEEQTATPVKTGKKMSERKRDNDIFSIRERATGEKAEVNEMTLQSAVKPTPTDS